MTPEEKAHELYDRFYNLIDHQDNYWSVDEEAKTAALMTVQEVLNALPFRDRSDEEIVNFWKGVSKELESFV